MKKLEEMYNWVYGYRRQIATWGLFVLAGFVAVHVVFGTNGWMVYEKKKTEYKQVNQEVEQLKQENQRLQDHITALKTDKGTIEKEAREQFKYARPGEVVLVMPAPRQEVTGTAQNKAPQNNPTKK